MLVLLLHISLKLYVSSDKMRRKIFLLLCLAPLIYPQILWEKTSFPDTICVNTLEFDTSSNILYAGTNKFGVYKSTDKGVIWEENINGLTANLNIHKILVVSSDKVYATTSDGVFKTINQGGIWQRLNITSTYFPSITASPEGYLYLATGEGIYKSTDEGESWAKIFFYGSLYTVLIDLQGNIYTSVSNMIYKSVDNGLSWKRIYELWNGPTCSSVHASAVTSRNNILFSMWVGGVYFSSDGGSTFTQRNDGLYSLGVNEFIIDEGGRISALLPSGYFYSIDEADSWKYLGNGLGNSSASTFTKDSKGYFYIGCYSGGIYRSKFTLFGFLPKERIKQYFQHPNTVTIDSILIKNKSDSVLTVYNIHSSNPVFNLYTRNFALNPDDSIYFVFSYSPVQNSIDIAKISFNNSSIIDSEIVVLEGYSGVPVMQIPFRTIIFKEVEIGLSTDTLITVKNKGVDTLIIDSIKITSPVFRFKPGENVILPGDSLTIQLTFEPSSIYFFKELLILYTNNYTSPDTIRLVGFSVPHSTEFKDATTELSSFELLQNYPNPFNPSTVISYQLPVKSFVSLILYDITGIEIATLVNMEEEAGVHNYELSINNYALTSGVYFYQLRAGEFVSTKKLILMK